MKDKLEKLQAQFKEDIGKVVCIKDLEDLRVKFIGRKGEIAKILKDLSRLSVEERPVVGKLANEIKNQITSDIGKKKADLKRSGGTLEKSKSSVDITLPGFVPSLGNIHPITKVIDEITSIFVRLGFEVALGPEVETDYYNFEALNTPEDHPARDEQDSFYITKNLLLRTQTSPIQIRVMEKRKPPLSIVAPGKCYRRDPSDASHSPMFHQIEGLMVDENVTFADLRGVLFIFLKAFFGEDIKMQFRPHFFPFTEPSAEVGVSCTNCKGKGCSVCSQTGWLEVLGCGMVDPEVFKKVGYDSEKYVGFAFGMGIERLAMLKYGIDDIRLFFENDLRFLKQF